MKPCCEEAGIRKKRSFTNKLLRIVVIGILGFSAIAVIVKLIWS